MQSLYYRPYTAEGFEVLEVPGGGSVFGFVFVEPFDVLLRQLRAEYLQAAWENLHAALTRHHLLPNDISYGWLHPGVGYVPGYTHTGSGLSVERNYYGPAPSDFTGWISCDLSELWREEQRYSALNDELLQTDSPLRCGYTYRSVKWRIRPDNYSAALRLLETFWTDDVVDWVPANIHEYGANQNSLWGHIAAAIELRNQSLLDSLMAEARAQYSPAGYKILVRGFASFIMGEHPPAYLGEHLSLEMRGPDGYSNIYTNKEDM